jgi:hypothetical protein
VSLAGISNSSDTTIQTLSSNLRIAPEGTRVENLNLVVVGLGTITGNGTIGADSSLDFHLVAQLANGGDMVGALTQIAGVKGSGLKSIPISVKGTTAKPIFIPDINSAMAGGATSGIGSGAQVQQNPVGSILGIFGKKKK